VLPPLVLGEIEFDELIASGVLPEADADQPEKVCAAIRRYLALNRAARLMRSGTSLLGALMPAKI
jgi:hypothetical protein